MSETEKIIEKIENMSEEELKDFIFFALKEMTNRVKKAIEYMESIKDKPDADMYMSLGEYKEYKELLKILKGISMEEDNVSKEIEKIVRYCRARECNNCKYYNENGILCNLHNPSAWNVEEY